MKTFTIELSDEDAEAIEDAIFCWRQMEIRDQAAHAELRVSLAGAALAHICREFTLAMAIAAQFCRGGPGATVNLVTNEREQQ